MALFSRERVEFLRYHRRVVLQKGVPIVFKLLDLGTAPLDLRELALRGGPLSLQSTELPAQFLERDMSFGSHVLKACALAVQGCQPAEPGSSLRLRVSPHRRSLYLDHGVEAGTQPVRILQEGCHEIPNGTLDVGGRVALPVGTSLVAVFVAGPTGIVVVVTISGAGLHALGLHPVKAQPAPRDPARELPEATTGIRRLAVILYRIPRSVYQLARDPGVWDRDVETLLERPLPGLDLPAVSPATVGRGLGDLPRVSGQAVEGP